MTDWSNRALDAISLIQDALEREDARSLAMKYLADATECLAEAVSMLADQTANETD